MKSKYRKIYIEWWDIKRSIIYRGVGFIVVLAVLVGGGWWLWRNNFFLPNPEIKESPKDAARLLSFEGDVRIIRAATRETFATGDGSFVCKSLQAGRKSSSASATKKAIGVVIL
jgi:hypothetical protein